MNITLDDVVCIESASQPIVGQKLENLGIRVFQETCDSDEEIIRRLQGKHTLIHFFTDRPLPVAVLNQSEIKEVYIAGPSAGCFVGSTEFKKFKIYDTPAKAINSVAEHTLCLIMMLARNMRVCIHDINNGGWPTTVNQELAGARIGLIGFGEIARRVAFLCRSLNMDVVVSCSSSKKEEVENLGYEFLDLEYLLKTADFVSIHKRLTDDTRHLLSYDILSRAKPGIKLINTSRAELIEEDALCALLANGIIGGVALDVFSEEPLPDHHPFRQHKNVIVTPHNAWLSEASVDNMISAAFAGACGDQSRVRRICS